MLKVFVVEMYLSPAGLVEWTIVAKSAAEAWKMAGDDWNMRGEAEAIVKSISVKEAIYNEPKILSDNVAK